MKFSCAFYELGPRLADFKYVTKVLSEIRTPVTTHYFYLLSRNFPRLLLYSTKKTNVGDSTAAGVSSDQFDSVHLKMGNEKKKETPKYSLTFKTSGGEK